MPLPTASECELTNIGRNTRGYRKFYVGNKDWLAHRYAYTMTYGEIPKGFYVLHKCHVRNCINPKHLYAGTAKDNARDCWDAGRNSFQKNPKSIPRGSSCKSSKLKESDIVVIFNLRKSGWTIPMIMRKFKITENAVYLVLNRKTWKHVKI